MNTTEQDDYDPTPYIVTEGAPNPYDDPAFDGKQAVVTDDNKLEGLGGDTYPESPLGIKAALYRLFQLAQSNATHMWSGLPIHMYCLALMHEASETKAYHASAKDDALDNPDLVRVTYDDVDWAKVPDGSLVYFQVGLFWHIARKITSKAGKVLIVSSDVIEGQVGYVEPTWFQVHWGASLYGYSRICNLTWQKGLPGNDQQQGGQGQGKGQGWPGATEARVAVGILHNQILPPLAEVTKIAHDHAQSPVWDKAAADLTDIAQRIKTVHDDLEAVTQPK